MDLTAKVPDASTLSQNRIHRFNDSDVFQQIFDHIVEQALTQGGANGRVLYTDSNGYGFLCLYISCRSKTISLKWHGYVHRLDIVLHQFKII